MGIKIYRIYCEICGYNRVTDGSQIEDHKLKEVPRVKIQRNIPVLDEQNKTIPSEFCHLPKIYKCPKCGRGMRIKKI